MRKFIEIKIEKRESDRLQNTFILITQTSTSQEPQEITSSSTSSINRKISSYVYHRTKADINRPHGASGLRQDHIL